MLLALVIADLKIILRNRQALFWALAFPLIFVVVFGLFDLDHPPTRTVGVVDHAGDPVSQRLVRDLGAIEDVKVELRQDEEGAREEVLDGDIPVLLVIPAGLSATVDRGERALLHLLYDEDDPSAARVVGRVQRFLDQENLRMSQAPQLLGLLSEGVRAHGTDYFDFLLPGLVAMGVMTYSIIGLASTLAVYRERQVLKRVLATPLRVRTFFGGLVLSHLVLALAQSAVILGAGVLLFGGRVHGSLLYLGVLVLIGNLIFLGLGFIVGAHVRTAQAASGLGNAVALPLMFLSGTFFPTENLPGVLAKAVEYLPLAALLDAMRGVALHGESLLQQARDCAILGAWIAGTAVVAVKTFKFR